MADSTHPVDVPDEIRQRARAAFSGRPPMPEGVYVLPLNRNPWTALEEAIAAVVPAIRQAERGRATARLEALRDGIANPDTTYNEAFIHALDCAIREIKADR